MPGTYKDALDKRREDYKNVYAQLAREGVLHSEDHRCVHDECATNMMDISGVDGAAGPGPRYRRWCKYDMLALRPEQNLSDGVNSLYDLDHRLFASGGCQWEGDDPRLAAATGQAKGLRTLMNSEGECCGPDNAHTQEEAAARARARALQGLAVLDEPTAPVGPGHGYAMPTYNVPGTAGGARARGLAALSAIEAPELDECPPPNAFSLDHRAGKKAFLQRHRLELPREKAAMFATTTGPWQDSGMMPEPVHTNLMTSGKMPGIQETDTTTTGAMMEFLGDANLSSLDLPFSNDMTSSQIPLPQAEFDLALLDELIATTAAQQAQATVPAPTTSGVDDLMTNYTAMDDADFGDMNFDSVFDMPMDDTFVFEEQ